MRKIMAFVLSAFMAVSLISCGDIKSENSGKTVTSGYSATAASVSGVSSDVGQDTLEKEQIEYKFNDYEPVWYKDVVWNAMSEKMSKEDYEEFCEYLPALTGETVVHWQAEDKYEENGISGSDQTIQQLLDKMQEEIEDKEDIEGQVMSVSFWDMTRDGVKELMLEASHVTYPNIIIHKEGNEFYGRGFGRRSLLSPQKGGYFWTGKGNGSWNCLTFKDKKFEITNVAAKEQRWEEDGTVAEEKYCIQNKEVNKKQYEKWEKENLGGEVDWYELPGVWHK